MKLFNRKAGFIGIEVVIIASLVMSFGALSANRLTEQGQGTTGAFDKAFEHTKNVVEGGKGLVDNEAESGEEDGVYTITYFVDGGTLIPGAITKFTEDDEFDLPVPEKEGYRFRGWYLSSGQNSPKLDRVSKGTNGDLYLYAKWAVETLAGTEWVFNNVVTDFEFLGTFDYENQTGWESFTDGTMIIYGSKSNEIWGFTISELAPIFCTVQSMGNNQIINVQSNLAQLFGKTEGWYFIDGETTRKLLTGSLTLADAVLKSTKINAPTVIFGENSNQAVENEILIDWLYENATMIR